jgi:CheY-like chemotaxis protein/HPt (histidine-containing phosphotransfer) domain-containing protein
MAAFKAAGIEEYLVKPVKQSRLYDCLADVMSQAGSEAAQPEPSAGVLPATSAAAHAERILLAEDNMINQKVALRQLLKLGYTADAVADGQEVLEALKRFPYKIILMDCQMPDLDGYDTTRRIRREQTRPVHIIAMTAHAMQGDREKCLAAGMDDYLTKPVRTEELRAALARWQPPAPVEDSPVDLGQLRDAADDDAEEMRSLAATYLEQADEIMPALADAVAAGTAPKINTLAHKLAGSSASCGMTALVPLLRELEQMGRTGELATAAEGYERAVSALARTRHFLALHLPPALLSPEAHPSPSLITV